MRDTTDQLLLNDEFQTVPIVQTDGKAVRIPVELTDSLGSIDMRGRVLHIVTTSQSFCAWRAR